MAIANAHHSKLLLTADLMQRDRQYGAYAQRLDGVFDGQLVLRFPPIEDVVGALDSIASREIAA